MSGNRIVVVALLSLTSLGGVQGPAPDGSLFIRAASTDARTADAALEEIASGWRDGYAAMIVDMARLMPSAPSAAAGERIAVDPEAQPPFGAAGPPSPAARRHPAALVRARLIRFLEHRTGKRFGNDLWKWREWIWQLPYEPHPDYFRFKGELYALIDPKFREFFAPGNTSLVRLDEVDWGGVGVNGIPPLDRPATVPAREARYLKDAHVVFGIFINGEARAYPRRILAWHELARDRLGGIDVTIVYCTLCGTVIPYESRTAEVTRTFGTSGLLYRSNKLMFDEETKSLWSSLEGRPVIGPLAGSNLELKSHPVVTTTWGEWRREHPETTVLSIETGFRRDYSEGAAYREYFSHDRLMFGVSRRDPRLRNKAEVLSFVVRGESGVRIPVGIAADLLRKKPVYELQVGGRQFVVLTTAGGANRLYEAAGRTFTSGAGGVLKDGTGATWQVTEEALTANGRRLARVPARRVFWFAWYAQFPDTVLFK
jgi:hypothetical protein